MARHLSKVWFFLSRHCHCASSSGPQLSLSFRKLRAKRCQVDDKVIRDAEQAYKEMAHLVTSTPCATQGIGSPLLSNLHLESTKSEW